MELEGLMHAVKFLVRKGFSLDMLVTDRHCQITKWVRENLPNTDHRYDIWHVAKGKIFERYCHCDYRSTLSRISKKIGKVEQGEGM